MKSSAFILFLVFYGVPIFAQAPDTLWTRTFGDSGYDSGYSVQQTTDGGYIITGRMQYFGTDNIDVWLIKTDANGDTLWTRTFDGPDYPPNNKDWGNSVQQTADGGYIITGVVDASGRYTGDIWLIKTDADGDTLWTKTFGEGEGRSVQQTTDGGYIITGVRWHPYYNSWLIKTDTNGDTLWTKTFGDSGLIFEGNSVLQTTDEGYIIVGTTHPFYSGDYDVWLMKTDAYGDTLWTKTVGGESFDVGASIQQISVGGYIIVGMTGSFGAGILDVWLIRTDADGDTLWTKTFGGIYDDRGNSVQQTTDGGFIIAGRTESFGAGDGDVWLIKTNANGDSIWTKTLGGIFTEWGNSVDTTSDGGYIITGYGDGDVLLIKVAPDVTTLAKDPQASISSFELRQNYPNPFNPSTTIEFSLPQSNFVTLKIYNILGEEVAMLVSERLAAGSYKYDWDASSLASGVYLYRIQAGNYVESRKMVLLR